MTRMDEYYEAYTAELKYIEGHIFLKKYTIWIEITCSFKIGKSNQQNMLLSFDITENNPEQQYK